MSGSRGGTFFLVPPPDRDNFPKKKIPPLDRGKFPESHPWIVTKMLIFLVPPLDRDIFPESTP